jgi:spore germination protein (amino acid permease)
MTDNRNAITKMQLFCLVTQSQIGIGIMSLPHDAHQYAKGDAWLSVLAAGVVAQCMIVLLWLLCVRLPRHTFFQMVTNLWGKVPGFIVNLYYASYFVLVTAIIIDSFSEVVIKWLLPFTPSWAIYFVALSAGVYLAAGSLPSIARFYAVAMFNLALLIFLMLLGLDDIDIRYVLPAGQSDVNGLLQGMFESLFSYKGYEVLLFVFPFVTKYAKGKEILYTASAANALTTMVYVFVVLICTTYFSPSELGLIDEPVLYLLSSYSIVLMERVDMVFTAVWMVTVATSYGTYLYLAASGLTGMFGRRDIPALPLLLLAAGVCFAYSFLPPNIQTRFDSYGNWLDLVGLLILPMLALLTACMKQARRRKKS